MNGAGKKPLPSCGGAVTDQKQAPERIDARIPDHCGWAARGRWKEAYAAACDEITHMKAERDQLAAEVERVHFATANLMKETCRQYQERAEKAEVERDQALAASAAREIALRDRAVPTIQDGIERLIKNLMEQALTDYEVSLDAFKSDPELYGAIKSLAVEITDRIALPLSPDGQQALDDVRWETWQDGYMIGHLDGMRREPVRFSKNPYRTQPSRSSDAGQSEDRE